MLFNRKIKFIFLPIYFSFFSLSNFTKAEINLNSINETKTIINKPNNSSCKSGYCNIYGGIKSGKNLFHKFNSFDTRGRIKEVKFFNESQKNVIVGVSSKNGTFINKPIKLQGLANLFWVSPYGLKIEKGGVFVNTKSLNFSTANYLNSSEHTSAVLKNNKYHLKASSYEQVFNNKPHSKKNNLNLANVEISDTNIVVNEKLYIHSPNGSVHIDNSKLKTSAKNNGEITITGESVFLNGNSHLISMGKDFGGLIQIGGSWQNSNKQISQSNKTIIEDKVVINASSNNGKGGIIVIWSDINNKKGLTRVKGTLISNGNKGGSIETSGANLDVKDIEISLKSKKGSDGLWLLDPFDFVINKTTKVSIENALKKGTNVIITTSNEIDFDEYIKPLENRWSKFIRKEDQNFLVHSNDYGYFNLEVGCNWKFAIENYCESYHLPTIHPELNKVSNINDHYHIQGLPNRFAGQGSKKYEQPMKGNKKFNTFSNWDKGMIKNSEYIALFPNIMIGLHIDHFYVFWLEPLAMNKTKEHMQMYYVGDESANGNELKDLRKENSRFWKDVMLEDVRAIEGMQEGRNSPVYNGGNFSPVMDQPTHQFHKWVANSLMR